MRTVDGVTHTDARRFCATGLVAALLFVYICSGMGLAGSLLAADRVPVGDQAPDFALTTSDGEEFRLSQFAVGRPVVLAFVRAHW